MSRPTIIERIRRRTGEAGVGITWAVVSFIILAASGAIGIALALPWLFPSMGPTVMLMFGSPEDPSARPLNAAVGHARGHHRRNRMPLPHRNERSSRPRPTPACRSATCSAVRYPSR